MVGEAIVEHKVDFDSNGASGGVFLVLRECCYYNVFDATTYRVYGESNTVEDEEKIQEYIKNGGVEFGKHYAKSLTTQSSQWK